MKSQKVICAPPVEATSPDCSMSKQPKDSRRAFLQENEIDKLTDTPKERIEKRLRKI